MTQMTSEWTQGEIVRSLERIERVVGTLDLKVDALTAGFVPRSEWQLRADSQDARLAELKAARAPWWTWATLILAILTVLMVLLPKLVD